MIFYNKNQIRIQNFLKMGLIDSNCITITYLKNQTLWIKGKKLKIIYFEKDEVIIQGEISILEFKNGKEN